MTDPTFRDPNSRYDGLPLAEHRPDGGGAPRLYITRRFIAPPDRQAVLTEHTVEGGDRIDRIAFTYLGDPEAAWRLADANAALAPAELTARIGRRIRITLPAGIPGDPNAR